MRKSVLILAGVLALCVAAAAAPTVIKVKVQSANVRQEPNLQATIIARATQGTLFEVNSKIGEWYEVTVDDDSGKATSGYLHSSVVEVVTGSGAGETAKPAKVVENEDAAEPEQPARNRRAAAQEEPEEAYEPPARGNGGVVILGGAVLSNLAISESLPEGMTKGSRFGFGGGLGFEIAMTPSVSLFPSFMFSTGGAKLSGSGGYMMYQANAVAGALQFKFNLNGPFLAAGPYAAYVMSPKMLVHPDEGSEQTEDIPTESLNMLQYGLLLGGGYEADLGSMRLMIMGAYNLGLSKLNKEGDGSIKPNSINLMIGFKL